MMTRGQVAKRLGVSVAAVRRFEGEELQPELRDGKWLFDADEVENLAQVRASGGGRLDVPFDEQLSAGGGTERWRGIPSDKAPVTHLEFEQLQYTLQHLEIMISSLSRQVSGIERLVVRTRRGLDDSRQDAHDQTLLTTLSQLMVGLGESNIQQAKTPPSPDSENDKFWECLTRLANENGGQSR